MSDKYNNKQLYSYSTKGKIKLWKAGTDLKLNSDKHIEIIIEWGYQDGAMQTKSI
jgi:hypothetical protein